MRTTMPMFALAGCARPPPSDTGGDYSCRLEGQGQQAKSHMVAVAPQAQGKTLDVSIDHGPKQTLAQVAGPAPSLFSNAAYAWQLSSGRARLTDIDKVQSYACVAVPHANEASSAADVVATNDADRRFRAGRHARDTGYPR